jgi:hypothetical protein
MIARICSTVSASTPASSLTTTAKSSTAIA